MVEKESLACIQARTFLDSGNKELSPRWVKRLLDHGIVEGKGRSLNKEFDFRSWHCGRQEGGGSLNKELDFRSWHCGRQAN